ncbi:MAG: type II CAAX endopeptidase family protein [Hyphomonas sp.]
MSKLRTMVWTAFTVAVAYQFILILPVIVLRAAAPDLSIMMLMGLAFVLAGLALYGYLRVHDVADEVLDPGDINGMVLVMAVGAAILSIVVTMLLSGLLSAVFGTDGLSVSEPFAEQMQDAPTFELLFTVVLVGPVIEEMIYRGLLMGVLLARGWAPLAAAGLSAAIFAVQHIQYGWIGMLSVAVYGFTFGLLRVACGGLFAPVVAHILINLTVTALQ